MTIGNSIRKARESKGYSRRELAEAAGISVSTFENWEFDRFYPALFGLICVADVLEMSLDELIGREVKKHGNQ
jgi:transcriptional regulator with XRE-family HTH domain